MGSPHYLAPEVITDSVVSHKSDWWAVGVIMFEMLIGSPPYNGNTPDEIFENILKDRKDTEVSVGYQEDQISPEADSLIKSLLARDPDKRLGANGCEEIKQHPFFQGVNWQALRSEEPPFVPSLKNLTDSDYFPVHKKFSTNSLGGGQKKQKVRMYSK